MSLCLAGLQFPREIDRRASPTGTLSPDSIVVDFRVASAYEAARIAAARLGLPWPLPAPRGTPLAIRDAPRAASTTQDDPVHVAATFLVLAPEYSPDSVNIRIAIPNRVADILCQIDDYRSSAGRSLFPVLHPVHPQPDVRWGLVVATPLWLSSRVVLCLDLTLLDGRIFATVAPPDLDKHILLNMAGLSGGAPVEVYLPDVAEPVEYGAELFVSNGDCISFVPAQEPLEFRCSLQAMLEAPFGWAGGPAFPQAPPGDRFCVVSEGFYCDFHLHPDRAPYYRSDLAARLRVPIHTLCMQPAAPRQSDVTLYGRLCRTVICISSSPPRDDDEVALLDCRPILEGWSKVSTTGRWLDVRTLRHSLSLAAPAGHSVELSECCRHWNWLWLNPGQVVVVSYIATDQVEPMTPSERTHTDRGEGDHRGADPDHHGEPGAISTAQSAPKHTNGVGVPSTQSDDGHVCEHAYGLHRFTFCISCPAASAWRERLLTWVSLQLDFALEVIGKFVKWGNGFIEHAKRVGNHDLTPVSLPVTCEEHSFVKAREDLCGLDACSAGQALSCTGWQCKLLEEPTDSGRASDLAFHEACTAARALGTGWPFPPYQWIPQQIDEDGDEDVSLSENTDALTDVVFYILVPGFTGEQVTIPIVLPQTVADTMDLVQERRTADRRELFPLLVPVTPQFDPGWAVLLAIPSWVQRRVIVCLDLSLLDNRIVPADVPALSDYQTLCESAGLPPDSVVDIYLPGIGDPLPRGTDYQLWTGVCIAFVSPGSRRPDAFDLGTMLRSHLGWEQAPALPRDSLDNGYCVVGPRGPCLFRLHAERARHHQSDIALLTGIHPSRVVLTPALEQPMNVCIAGWECRAVIAATDRQERYDWNEGRSAVRVGILDCRAAFLGWLLVHTWDDWLQLDPIRRNIDLSAPDGWHTVFPQFPRHWTWVWFQPGQIILVAFEEDTPAQLAPEDIDGDPFNPEPASPGETDGEGAPSVIALHARGTTTQQPAMPSSRGPPADPDTADVVPQPSNEALRSSVQRRHEEFAGKWSLGTFHGAKHLGTLSLTPAGLTLQPRPLGPFGALRDGVTDRLSHCSASSQGMTTCKLLQEPGISG